MRKIHALLLILAMAVGLSGYIGSQPTANTNVKTASNAYYLLSALPASDTVVYVDARKILNDTLPTAFANRPDMMAKIRSKLELLKQDVGIDPNTIETAAMGASFHTKSNGDNVVVIVRGSFNASSAIDAGMQKAQKKGAFQRQETVYEGRTIYSLKRISNDKTSKSAGINLKDSAVTILDSNTIAVSDIKGIRATIDAAMGKNRVSDELVALATRNSSALVGFSGNTKAFSDFHFDFGKGSQFLEGVNQFYGSIWTNPSDIEGQLTLRTDTTERASDLRDTLNGLKLLASGFKIGGKDGAALQEMLKSITIASSGNEVDVRGKATMNSISLIIDKF